MNEGVSDVSSVPFSARLPHGDSIRLRDEKALDEYCRLWNNTHKLKGDYLSLDWNLNPNVDGAITFKVEIK